MAARRPDSSEEGTTLVELVVTVAIMGFAMLAIMGGVGTSIIFGSIQRQDAAHRLVLTTAAEKIVSEVENSYKACAPQDTNTYKLPADTPGYTLSVSKVAFWEPSTNQFIEKTDPSSACFTGPPPIPDPPADLGPPTDNGLQLIELKVTSSSGGARAPKDEFLQVVKRAR